MGQLASLGLVCLVGLVVVTGVFVFAVKMGPLGQFNSWFGKWGSQPSAPGASIPVKDCISICAKTGGQASMTPPGRLGVTFGWCSDDYATNPANAWGCICDEPKRHVEGVGCI